MRDFFSGLIPFTNDIKIQRNMQVKLIPSPESGLEEIIIDDQVFSVGRNHKPFETYPPAVVGQLSRRHARIFKENGLVFLVDTGSRNGTSLNQKKLKDTPVSLSSGDVIGFSNQLIYSVVIDDRKSPDSTVLASDAEIRLTLVASETALEPIVVTRFPFLVSKTDRVFANSAPEYAQDIRYLSRKHAYFYAKDAEVYIEDLGSTNGTYVNGARLSEQPATLNNGDTIGFGGKRLVYTVNIAIKHPLREAMTDLLNNGVETRMREIVDQQKTTFIANPNSFLEIFCAVAEESPTPVEDEIDPEIESPAKNPKPAKTPIGRFYRKARIFLRQARSVLAEESTDSKKPWIIVAVIVLIITAGLALYWKGANKRDIQNVMDQANYERGLELASEYLEQHPEDRDIRRIATEAMLRVRVPQWIDFIQEKEYQKAREMIGEATDQDTRHNEESAKLIGVLEWVGNLEQFVDERGGIDAPLTIFKHEQPITALLEWWERDEENHTKALQLIANSIPRFEAIGSRAFSDLRKLQNDRSLHLKAIEQLKAAIAEKLDRDQGLELREIFDKFAQKYPRIEGMDQLRRDLESYLALKQEIERKHLGSVIAFLSENPLTTPPFRDKVAELTNSELPSEEFRESYRRSSEAWRSGNVDEAIAILGELSETAGREFAGPELERKKNIRARFRGLDAIRDTGNYRAGLLEFYSLLDEQEDTYFLDAIDSEVKQQIDSIAKAAEQEMKMAESAWQTYLANGKITGIQRLESGISQVFRTQAKRLSDAGLHAVRAIRDYEAARVSYAPERKALYDEISRETKLQRQSLTERENVLDPKTLKAKLDLLPEPPHSVSDDPIEP
ncbi:MAG: FHA domain-containing protein [Methylococcales bacterium]